MWTQAMVREWYELRSLYAERKKREWFMRYREFEKRLQCKLTSQIVAELECIHWSRLKDLNEEGWMKKEKSTSLRAPNPSLPSWVSTRSPNVVAYEEQIAAMRLQRFYYDERRINFLRYLVHRSAKKIQSTWRDFRSSHYSSVYFHVDLIWKAWREGDFFEERDFLSLSRRDTSLRRV